MLLFEDETILRLLPALRRAWAMQGQQQPIAISGRNAQRVLFGTINLHTGQRIIMAQRRMGQAGFQQLLQRVRYCYKGRPVYMLLDNATAHTAKKSLQLADRLNIHLVWLPRQCSELNAMDHLWRSLKKDVSANHQYPTIEEHAAAAIRYVQELSNTQARVKAGILSDNFWLKSFL